MTKYNLEAMKKVRPVDRDRVDEHKRQMMAEVRAYQLRELREEMGLTQVEVAKRLNVSQNRVSRLETGDLEHSQIDTLRRYVEAVGGSLRIEAVIGNSHIPLT